MRRVDETVKTPEIRYIPSKWDPTQLTELIISPASGVSTQTVFLRMRDKYQFNVGTGLTMSNLKFEMLDTYVYYDYKNKEFWSLQASDAKTTSCTVASGAVNKCNGKTTFETPRPP